MNRMEKGFSTEKYAIEILKPYFDSIIKQNFHSASDIYAIINKEKYGINVKAGKKYYGINKNNLIRMIKERAEAIPSFLLVNDECSYLFTLKEIYPNVEKPKIEKVILARDKILEIMKNSKEPISTDEIVNKTRLPRSTVHYNTTVLVKEGKLKRFKGLPGVFVSVEKGEA